MRSNWFLLSSRRARSRRRARRRHDHVTRSGAVMGEWVLPAVVIVLVVPFVMIVALGFELHGHTEQATEDSLSYVATVAQSRVETFVEAAEEAVHDTQVELRNGTINDSVHESTPALQGVLQRQDQVRAVVVAYPDGSYAIVRHDDDGYFGRTVDVGSATREYSWEWDADFALLSREVTDGGIDVREIEWYRQASVSTESRWTQPALRTVTRTVGVWVSAPVRDERGELVAVVAADILLEELSRSINVMPPGVDTEAFVLAADRTVVAAPVEYGDAIDEYAAEYELATPASVLGVSGQSPAQPRDDGDSFAHLGNGSVILERGLAGATGVDWVIHVAGTQSGLSPALADLDTSLTLIAGVMVVALVTLLAFVGRLWRPIMETRSQALRDPLTGLSNRASFEREAPLDLVRAHRKGGRLAVAMCDLDGFKTLNDVMGHDAGDRALVAVARAVDEATRDTDIVARWGGDEFLMALALGENDEPATVVERVRLAIERGLVATLGQHATVGATVGVAVSESPHDSIGELITRADEQLLEGKRARKGATYVADPLLASTP